MKKLLYIILILVLIPVLAFALWFGYLAWPRSMEPELWSAEELKTILEDPAQNGWRFFVKSSGLFKDSLKDLPDDLNDLAYPHESDPEIFWEESETLKSSLASYFKAHAVAHERILQNYRRLLDYPQFVDLTQPSMLSVQPQILPLVDLNRLGMLNAVWQALEGNWEEAHGILSSQLRLNISFCHTARSTLSQLAALANLKVNLETLALLRDRYPQERWDEIAELLRSIDWGKIDFKRAIVAEYYTQLEFVDWLTGRIPAEEARAKGMPTPPAEAPGAPTHPLGKFLARRMLNPALLRKRINEQFRSYEATLQDPLRVSDDPEGKSAHVERSPGLLSRIDPNEMLLNLMTVSLEKRIRDFYQERQQLEAQAQKLLQVRPSAPSPESSPTETSP